jgi:acyl carrier protein
MRMTLVRAHVRSAVANVLGFDREHPIDPRQGFFKLGMTSLMAVELRRRLEHSLGRPLPPTLAFEYPTIDALARHLVADVLGLEDLLQPVAPGPQRDTAATTLATASPSEEELTARLVAKLREIT